MDVDAVIVGAGINGMSAAAYLAQCGWKVALLDANPRIGGFIAGGETDPGFFRDTYSSWHPQFLGGPAYGHLGNDLHRHGLRYAMSGDKVTASIDAAGTSIVAFQDDERTAAQFAHRADRQRYIEIMQRFGVIAEDLVQLLDNDLFSARALAALMKLARHPAHVRSLAIDIAASGRGWTQREFTGREVDQLWIPWLLHAGLSPDHAGGGLMLPFMAAGNRSLPVVKGGSEQFISAFESLLRERSVQIVTDFPVTQVMTTSSRHPRAIGVRGPGGAIRARRAVLLSVHPHQFPELLSRTELSARRARDSQRFRPGRGAMQIHATLDRPLKFTDPRLVDIPLVHISNGSPDTGIACAEADAGLLPRQPTVVVGRQHVLDPTRVPPSRGQLWIQLQEVPYQLQGDAGGEIDCSQGWTPEVAKSYTQRVLQRIEAVAPGTADSVRTIDVIAPPDLEQYNRNAVGGDPYGGALELDQNFIFRPSLKWGSYRTGISHLWHIGASAHPGPGLSGRSGIAVAKILAD